MVHLRVRFKNLERRVTHLRAAALEAVYVAQRFPLPVHRDAQEHKQAEDDPRVPSHALLAVLLGRRLVRRIVRYDAGIDIDGRHVFIDGLDLKLLIRLGSGGGIRDRSSAGHGVQVGLRHRRVLRLFLVLFALEGLECFFERRLNGHFRVGLSIPTIGSMFISHEFGSLLIIRRSWVFRFHSGGHPQVLVIRRLPYLAVLQLGSVRREQLLRESFELRSVSIHFIRDLVYNN